MRVHSTRGQWTVLVSVAIVCVVNLQLAFCEKESENEGKAEELRQFTCCARYEKIIDVGYGISGEVIQIDAGHCRKLCPRHVSDDPGDASRPAVQVCHMNLGFTYGDDNGGSVIAPTIQSEKTVKRNTSFVSWSFDVIRPLCQPRCVNNSVILASSFSAGNIRDLHLTQQNFFEEEEGILFVCTRHSRLIKCSSDSHCRARAAKLQRVSTLQGVHVIEAIDVCECSPESACRRESYTHHVHSGTPHQTVIDVGVCIGHCGKDLGCKPIRNNTISVKGPNGDEIYQVVENCGCAGHCHRMDHMETVLDYSEVPLREGTNTTDVRPMIRQINVGQCVGTCPGNETETCLLRDKKEPSRCLAGLYSKQHTCTPARFKVHEYRIRRGAKREIIQITQCACV